MPANILMFHKPKGLVVTRQDELGRKTVYDVLPAWVRAEGWVPVGRLDRDSRGLLLVVRQPNWVERLAKPGAFKKIYEVWVRGRLTQDQLEKALTGVKTSLGEMKAKDIQVKGGAGPKTRLEVVLEEGKNRQIRRIFGGLIDPVQGTALKVTDLKRIRFGPLSLDIASGEWRYLTPAEEAKVLSTARAV